LNLHAQPAAGSPAGFAAEAKQSYTMIRNNITKAAEEVAAVRKTGVKAGKLPAY